MKPHDVLYLKINDVCEYNLPYPQTAFIHTPGMTKVDRVPRNGIEEYFRNNNAWKFVFHSLQLIDYLRLASVQSDSGNCCLLKRKKTLLEAFTI